MPSLLNSLLNAPTVDPAQITVRPSVPTASSSSQTAANGFGAALDQARRRDDSNKPDNTAVDKPRDVKPTGSTKKPDASTKKKPGKSTVKRKKSDAKPVEDSDAKAAVTKVKAASDEPAPDSEAHAAPPPPAAESPDSVAAAKAASDLIAAQQVAARNAAATNPAAAQAAAQAAMANQPPVPAPVKPPTDASTARPIAKVATDPTPAPAKDAQAKPTGEDASQSIDAPKTDAASTDTAQSDSTAPVAATGLKPVAPKTVNGNKPMQWAATATDQSASLNAISEFDESGSDADGTSGDDVAPAAAPGASPAVAAGLDASAQLAGNPIAPTVANSFTTSTKTVQDAPATTRSSFVAANQPSIVKSVTSELLPAGGIMHMRLDPPELGVLQVSVHVKDGIVSASFQTSNDDATKLLSHSLGQLKTALESQGVTVGKMHVQQTPKDQGATNRDPKNPDSNQQPKEGSSSRQDEQRREALKRMWERLALGSDPLDMVA